jgi:glycolate oxidase FAD binding subunit
MSAALDRLIAPESEAGLAEALIEAHAAGSPLAIEGNGTKRGMLRPVEAARTLSTRALTGITLYRPTELVLSARAGTPIPEIEAALAAEGQQLIAEPPDLGWMFGAERPPTLGGIVATNLSGPRRIAWGAVRDHVLGIRFLSGTGEVFRSGGRVLKNVTGLDLCKLLAGSHGTLGVLAEVTIKVLPAPEASATLALDLADVTSGVRALSAGLGSPYGVSGAALTLGAGGAQALLRLEDFAESVAYRGLRLCEELARFGEARVIGQEESIGLWRGIRDARPLDPAPAEAVWRLSLAPSRTPAAAAALRAAGVQKLLLDWGGGLVWAAGPAEVATHEIVMSAARAAGGSFTLFRAPEALRAAVPVLPAEPAPLTAIAGRVKSVLDPRGILNPGRMTAGC